jgi:hypothetical protein
MHYSSIYLVGLWEKQRGPWLGQPTCSKPAESKPAYVPNTSTEYYCYKNMFVVNGDLPQLQIIYKAKYIMRYTWTPSIYKDTHSQHPRNP